MIKHVFATMNEMLDDIIIHYSNASSERKQQLTEQLAVLKQFSDAFIEEWLQFEEKFADFRDLHCLQKEAGLSEDGPSMIGTAPHTLYPAAAMETLPMEISVIGSSAAEEALEDAVHSSDEQRDAAMCKGQGYFKLFMFRHAAQYFREAVRCAPEDNRARLFLAMTCMHLQEWQEAQRHFQLLVELTDNVRWQALGFNALGCIQAVRMNLEQAEQYFMKAHEIDPDFTEPLSNMHACQQHKGQLSLYFGSGQL
ncbi:hypothetical protein PAECIP111893_04403 [Paenibacillus plantiphilus]|uniref:Tetratricopeptide repeat protein n=1 Tax=Paenibacillus plantiphilus TaxID=2905650 RepID=A0ABM9CN79_9BACL|nr:hypothetical protein [Paenibacillus plantiphilus]CAH1218336.1 hypothetical protein PAECIP111893_04403 [Paenibacillus plantiphilus]